jgi:hypothetical protein
VAAIVLFFGGGKTLDHVLEGIAWRWESDAKDAELRRRHADDEHRHEMLRKELELERDFPAYAGRRALEAAGPGSIPALPPPDVDAS